MRVASHQDDVHHGVLERGVRFLRDDGNPLRDAPSGDLVDVGAVERDAAARRRQHPRKQAQHRRLARSVGTQKADDRAPWHSKRHAAENRPFIAGLEARATCCGASLSSAKAEGATIQPGGAGVRKRDVSGLQQRAPRRSRCVAAPGSRASPRYRLSDTFNSRPYTSSRFVTRTVAPALATP